LGITSSPEFILGMMNQNSTRLIFFLILLIGIVIMPFSFKQSIVSAHPPMDATPIGNDLRDSRYLNKNSCPDDPKNLVTNGGFFPDLHDTQYGSVVNGWEPFIMSGSAPQFRWVNNEGIFKSQSEQILSGSPFDAGLYQVVRNTQVNTYYWFRLGWAPAAVSYSGPNEPSDNVGVQVGFDPFGGTDPKSPNVTWGTPRFNDNKNLNRPELTLVFPARATSVTVYMRAIAKSSGGENRVWFNAVCMESRPELGAADPLPPTPTTAPSVVPTAVRPTAAPATRPPATRVAQAQPTNTAEVVIRAPDTPTVTNTPKPTNTPRYARPDATPEPGFQIDLGMGLIAGTGILFVIGAIVLIGGGVILYLWLHRR
jgi:hypothetical protein